MYGFVFIWRIFQFVQSRNKKKYLLFFPLFGKFSRTSKAKNNGQTFVTAKQNDNYSNFDRK
jgi:hypothetical protein